jgi:hypothetical protein
MGRADFLRLGDWNVTCWFCGFKRKASDMARQWQGFYVCREHWEARQPQDFARGIAEHPTPPWTQPQPAAVYTYTNLQIGIGDGGTASFQLGDGLYAVTVTGVKVAGVTSTYTTTAKGLITPTVVPIKGAIVTASGSETVPQ